MIVAVQLFDREGYYATVLASEADIRAAVSRRTARVTSCIACSIPYAVAHDRGGAPDVSLPDDFRSDLGPLDRPE